MRATFPPAGLAARASGLARFSTCQTRLCRDRGWVPPQRQDFVRRSALTSQAARRPRRRTDSMAMLFAAVHESVAARLGSADRRPGGAASPGRPAVPTKGMGRLILSRGPGDFHPRALPETEANLSVHKARAHPRGAYILTRWH